jgi:hypothetical protein
MELLDVAPVFAFLVVMEAIALVAIVKGWI